MLEHLEGADRAPELLALLDVVEDVVERPLGDPERRRREDQPLDVEPGHQLHPAAAGLAEDAVGGDPAVGQEDVVDLLAAERLDAADLDPLGVGRDRDHRQPVVLGAAAVGAGDDEDVVGEVGGADPGLLAVQHVVAVVGDRLAGEVADVGARFRLRHRDRLDAAAADPGEDLLLLLLAPEALVGAGDDQADAVAGHRDQAAHRLLEEDAGVDHAAAGAPVLLVDRDAEPAELGELLVDRLAVELAVAVGQPFALLRGPALALGEVADRSLEVALLVGQPADRARCDRAHPDRSFRQAPTGVFVAGL